jgi:hypothetical protein
VAELHSRVEHQPAQEHEEVRREQDVLGMGPGVAGHALAQGRDGPGCRAKLEDGVDAPPVLGLELLERVEIPRVEHQRLLAQRVGADAQVDVLGDERVGFEIDDVDPLGRVAYDLVDRDVDPEVRLARSDEDRVTSLTRSTARVPRPGTIRSRPSSRLIRGDQRNSFRLKATPA